MTKQQERSLRLRLSTLCMAAIGGKEGDLRQATESVLDYVNDLVKRRGPSADNIEHCG